MYLGSAKNLRIRNLLHFYWRLLTKKEAIPVNSLGIFARKLRSFAYGKTKFYPLQVKQKFKLIISY